MENVNQPKFIERDKIFKAKDIIVPLKYFGASFDKLKTNAPERARAIVLGYKAWKLGLNETQLRSVIERKVDDKEIIDILDYKEKKSIRSWSIFTKIKEDSECRRWRSFIKFKITRARSNSFERETTKSKKRSFS